MGYILLSIFVLCQTKREHLLPLVHPQTRRRVHLGLHTQVRASSPTNRCIQYGCGLAKLQKKLWATIPFFQSLSLDPPVTMEELYRRADKFSTLEDNIRATSRTVIITAQSNKPATKGLSEQKSSQGKS